MILITYKNEVESINCGNVDKCISIISEKLQMGGLSIFCGAGISFNSGIMTVEPLIKYLLHFLSADQGDIDLYLKDNKGIFKLPIPFEAIIESLKRNLQIENSKRSFIESFALFFNGKPNNYHELFAHLLLLGKLKFIVTTNFDTCLEQALHWEEGDSRVIIPYAESLETLKNIDITGKVIKLHGCKSKPEYLGATVEQITKTEYWQKTVTMLDKVFYEGNCSSVLFIGYSCSDMWDVVEYFNNCYLQNKKLVPCIYWQHSNDKNILISLNPQKMLEKHSTLFFGGDSDELISRLSLLENLEIKKPTQNHIYKILENDIPLNADYALGRLYQDSHYYDLAIKSYEKFLSKISDADTILLINTLSQLSIIYDKKNNFIKAENLIMKAMELTNKLDIHDFYIYIFDVVTQYANLLFDTNRFESAKEIYLININKISRIFHEIPKETIAPLGNLYNSLALVYEQLQDYDKAQKSFLKALDIFRECAKERPQEYLPDVSMVLCNWAILLNELNDFNKAEEFYREALKIRRKLTEVNAIYLSEVATTLNNLGVSQGDRKDYVSSNKSLEEALHIRRDLSKFSADIYLPYVATTLENLADNYLYLKNYKLAAKLCLEAVDIYRKFSDSKQGVYLAQLGNSLTDMANILVMDNKIEEALVFCEEAVSLRKELVELNRQAYLPDLLKSYMSLATIQQYINDDDKADKTYKSVLGISDELKKDNRQKYLRQRGEIFYNYANYKKKLNDFESCKRLYSKSLIIFKELSKNYPSTFLPNVRDILKQLCFINEKLNDTTKNNELWKKIIKIDKLLSQHDCQKYMPQTASDFIRLGDLQYEDDDILNSKLQYEEALQILKSLEFTSSSEYLQEIINILNKLGIINYKLSQFNEAIELYKEALYYNDMYLDKDSEESYSNSAMTNLNMGNSQAATGNFKESESSYKKALEIFKKLAYKDSEYYLYNLTVAQYNIGELYARRYVNFKEAETYMKNCVENRRKLVQIDEDVYFSHLTKALDLLGFIYFTNEYSEEAEICLMEILERCEKLSEKKAEKYLLELAQYQTAIARFYQYNKIDKIKSMNLAKKAINNLNQYTPCDEINEALEEAEAVLKYWS